MDKAIEKRIKIFNAAIKHKILDGASVSDLINFSLKFGSRITAEVSAEKIKAKIKDSQCHKFKLTTRQSLSLGLKIIEESTL